jgi:hypothetical protein
VLTSERHEVVADPDRVEALLVGEPGLLAHSIDAAFRVQQDPDLHARPQLETAPVSARAA